MVHKNVLKGLFFLFFYHKNMLLVGMSDTEAYKSLVTLIQKYDWAEKPQHKHNL